MLLRWSLLTVLAGCAASPPAGVADLEGCFPGALPTNAASIAIDVGRETPPEGEEIALGPYALDTPGQGLVEGGTVEQTPAWHLQHFPIGGADGREGVYLTRRSGEMRYRFSLPDGLYVVTLELIDTTFSRPDQRVFSVRAGEQVLAERIDVAASVGEDFAFDPAFAVLVQGGALELSIDPEPSAGGAPPLVAGLRVSPARTATPDAPTRLEARASVGANLVRWDPSPGAIGYEVRREGALLGSSLLRATHLVDRAAPVGAPVRYAVRAIGPTCLASPEVASAAVTAESPGSAAVRVVELEVADADLAWLDGNRASDDEVDAVARIDEVPYAVQIRNRGGSTRHLSKPGLRLDFADRSFEGREHWHLTSEIVDPTGLWQRASLAILEGVGAIAPRTETVLLVVNGESWGPYTAIEAVREEMLTDRGIDATGNLYRSHGQLIPEESPEALADRYPMVGDDEGADRSDLADLIAWIAQTPDDQFARELADRVDLASFVPYLAGQILVANHDVQDGGHFLYHDPARDLWVFVPWDFNNAVWTRATLDPAAHTAWERPGAGNLLWSRALAVDAVREELAALLERAIGDGGAFGPAAATDLIGALAAELEPEARRDPWRFRRRWEDRVASGPATLEQFAAERRSFLAEQGLGRLSDLARSPAHVVRVGRDAESTWIEVESRSGEPIPQSLRLAAGPPWSLPGVQLVRSGDSNRFVTAEPVATAGIVLITEPGQQGEREGEHEGEGEGEREGEAVGRLVDLVGAPPLAAGEIWTR